MEFIEYLVRLRGAREAAADLDLVGRSAEKTKEAFRGFAHLAFGGLAVFAGFEGIKHAVEDTQKLAVSAGSLAKVTGMNVNTSAQWLAVTNAFGVSSRTLTMSFRSLSTQTEAALGGTKKSKEAFQAMGISMEDLRKHAGNMNDLLGFVADKFNKMPGGVAKTHLATVLFGRGWQQLIPLLSQGSKGMDDLRKTAAAYGVTLGKDPLENARKLHEAEVKLQLAQTGLQVQLSEKLAPAFIWVIGKAIGLWGVIDKQLNPAWKWLTGVIKDASHWLDKHKDAAAALKVGLAVLVGALIAVKVATIAANVAMLGSPIGWVLLGIAALAAGFDLLWHKSRNFRNNLTAVWNWLKAATTDVVTWVINAFDNMMSFFGKLHDRISGAFTGIWDGVKSGLVDALNWVIGQINSVIGGINAVANVLPGVNNPLGTITPIGQSAPAKLQPLGSRVHSPAGTNQAPKSITPPGANMAPHGANISSIHIHIDGREIAHVTRRQIMKAMAANA